MTGVPGFENFLEGSPAFDPDGTQFAAHMNELLKRIGAKRPVLLTENGTADVTDLGKVYLLDGHTLTLDPAFDLQEGWWIYVKGPGTVEADAGDTIDGESLLVLEADQSALLVSNGDALIVKLEGGAGSGGGSGFTPRGAWDNAATYSIGHYVSFSGRTFASLVDDNIGNEPPAAEEDNEFWMWVPTIAGQDGDGENGVDGTDPGILLNWDTGTADEDPGPGKIRADHENLASAAQLFISKTSRGGSDIGLFLVALDESTSDIKGTLILTDPATEAQATFNTGAVTNETGYVKLAVLEQSGETSFGGGPISFQFSRSGDEGEDGTGLVDSVNGVSPVGGDVSLHASNIPVTPAGGLAASNVQSALEELDSDIASGVGIAAALAIVFG